MVTTLLVAALLAVPLGAAATGSGSTSSACPLPSAPGAYVFDISQDQLLAWDASRATAGPIAVSLPAGTYDVYLTSADDHRNKRHQNQTWESWYLVGGAGASAVFATPATPDLAEDKDIDSYMVGTITTTAPVDHVVAVHAAYPDDYEPHSVIPVCAGFYPTGVTPTSSLCPFPAGPGVVNISDQLLLAWDENRFMAGPVPFTITPGSYDIYMASYDNHSAKPEQNQKLERWYLQGLGGGATVFTTPATDDLPENTDLAVFAFGAVPITSTVDSVKAIHAEYPADEPHSVAPLCIAVVPAGTPPPGGSTTTTVDGTTGGSTTSTTGDTGTSGTSTSTTTATSGTSTSTTTDGTSGATSSTTATTGGSPADTTSTTGDTGTSATSTSTSTTSGPDGTTSATTTGADSTTTTDTTPGVAGTSVSQTSVAAGVEGTDAQSLQQLPLTGVELETAFVAIVALMFGVVLLRRARDWQSRLDRRAARLWRRQIS